MTIITVSFIALFVNWYDNRLLPLIRQFFLIANGVNEFRGSEAVIFHLLLESFGWNFIITWLFKFFQLCNVIST
jgi:hypothetical protein